MGGARGGEDQLQALSLRRKVAPLSGFLGSKAAAAAVHLFISHDVMEAFPTCSSISHLLSPVVC